MNEKDDCCRSVRITNLLIGSNNVEVCQQLCSSKRRTGFTLVELLVVIGIIIILIGLVITGVQYLRKSLQNMAVQKCLGETQQAFVQLNAQGRSGASLIQDVLMGHRLEFRPVRAVVGALANYWPDEFVMSWENLSGSATYGSILKNATGKYCGLLDATSWKASHLSRLPPQVYSCWDPALTVVYPGIYYFYKPNDERAWISVDPCAMSLIQHRSLSPNFAGGDVSKLLCEWRWDRIMQANTLAALPPASCPSINFGCANEFPPFKMLQIPFNISKASIEMIWIEKFYSQDSEVSGYDLLARGSLFLSKERAANRRGIIYDRYFTRESTSRKWYALFFTGPLLGSVDLQVRSALPFSPNIQQYPYDWQHLLFQHWPPRAIAASAGAESYGIAPRYIPEFQTRRQEFLDESEVMPDRSDPRWQSLIPNSASKPTWMGKDMISELLFAPWKYYVDWPIYVEVKNVPQADINQAVLSNGTLAIDSGTAERWKDEGNYTSTAAVLYSYAWDQTDWDRKSPGSIPPIWEMPFGRYALLRRDGSLSTDFQKRPFHKGDANNADAFTLEARGGTVADFTPLKTIELLQLVERLPAGEAGKMSYRNDRNSSLPFNDYWGNPLIIAAAGFVAPRYATYWIDRTNVEDTDWYSESSYSKPDWIGSHCKEGMDPVGLMGATWRPRPEYHASRIQMTSGEITYFPCLPGGRDFLKKQAERAYGASRMSYIAVGSMGPERGVFGLNNDVESVVPNWSGLEKVTWEASADAKVLRAAWLQVIDLCKVNEYGHEEMSQQINERAKEGEAKVSVQSKEVNGIRCYFVPPAEIGK